MKPKYFRHMLHRRFGKICRKPFLEPKKLNFPQWHALTREEQAKYYEQVRRDSEAKLVLKKKTN